MQHKKQILGNSEKYAFESWKWILVEGEVGKNTSHGVNSNLGTESLEVTALRGRAVCGVLSALWNRFKETPNDICLPCLVLWQGTAFVSSSTAMSRTHQEVCVCETSPHFGLECPSQPLDL